MNIVDEYYQNIIFQISSEQLVLVLREIMISKEKEIDLLKDKIKKFEEKRRAHEVWYQSLSPLRKLFAGRPPSHHQAVEYFVNVKERFQHIEQIKGRIKEIDRLIQSLQNDLEKAEFILPNAIIEELRNWKVKEDREK